MKKVTYIISNIDKALAFEWIAMLVNKQKFGLSFILLNPGTSALETFLQQKHIDATRITYRGKKDLATALFSTYRLLKKNKPDIVHCHLFDANLVGLTAAYLAGVKKRIYTRHHSSYHHEYYPSAVKYDKLCNWLATDIVAISENVRSILLEKENVTSKKIQLIHHGFVLKDFSIVDENRINSLKSKYNPAKKHPVIGVISRYTKWKGIQFVIPAFKKLLETHPDALLILANANGNYLSEIKRMLATLPENSYREVVFEKDIFALYKLFNVFIHVPINKHAEAFGQIYVESLAAEIPSVFTQSGIAEEFIEDKKNALLVSYNNSHQITEAILRILNDKSLAEQMIREGKKAVSDLFEINTMISKLEFLYNN